MKSLALWIALVAVSLGTGLAQSRNRSSSRKAIVVAFFDEERLQHPAGQDALRNFEYFFKQIRDIARRDFPNVELRILARGELLPLSDGTRLNVQNMSPDLGYVFSAPGKKHRVLTGVQTEADFACAAAAFFRRSSPACPK